MAELYNPKRKLILDLRTRLGLTQDEFLSRSGTVIAKRTLTSLENTKVDSKTTKTTIKRVYDLFDHHAGKREKILTELEQLGQLALLDRSKRERRMWEDRDEIRDAIKTFRALGGWKALCDRVEEQATVFTGIEAVASFRGNMPIFFLDADLRVKYYNDAWRNLIGPKNPRGMHIRDLLSKRSAKLVPVERFVEAQENLISKFEDKDAPPCSRRFMTPLNSEGRRLVITAHAVPVEWKAGIFLGLLVFYYVEANVSDGRWAEALEAAPKQWLEDDLLH